VQRPIMPSPAGPSRRHRISEPARCRQDASARRNNILQIRRPLRYAIPVRSVPLSAIVLMAALRALGADTGVEFFEKRIRPLLAEQCYECHSATAKKLKGGLHLDTRDGWAKGGDSGPAVVPGAPDRSLLIQAVRWADPDTQMPPKNKLTAAQIAALEEWVRLGAPDPRMAGASSKPTTTNTQSHWAYEPVRKPTVPASTSPWPHNNIDRFVLARLEHANLTPAAPAEAAALCRRLHFDLTGLPPTPEDLDAFIASARSDRPAAISNLVTRLLASPRFGEHWARHWFDVVRFGESLTLRGFIYKEAWRYRDYVIEAFNDDRPYDQFLREHLAGDLLPAADPPARQRQIVATTFLAMGNWNLEEQDKKLLRMDIVDEQLDTLGKAFLGQTIGCARCHDHKFDPIPARDYYAMAGILRNTRTVTNANVSGWLEVPLPVPPDQEAALRAHETAVAALQKQIKTAKDAAKGATSRADATAPAIIAPGALPGIVVDSAQARAVGTWKHSQFSKHYIGDGYWHDDNKDKAGKTLTFAPELPRPGRYEVRFAYEPGATRSERVPVTVFHADGETLVHVNERETPPLDDRFVSLGTFRFETNGFASALVANEGTTGFVTADAVQFLFEDTELGARPPSAIAATSGAGTAPSVKDMEDKLKKLQASGPKRPRALSVIEEDKIEDAFIHIRGSPHNPGAIVPRGFLTFGRPVAQQALPAGESGRRQLADWIASKSNPLTARVYVNRLWQWLIGEGLVRTVDNFGTTGEAASHPELLDYLAARLMEQGWSTKRLIQEIVLSHTYQLSSARSPSDADPGNRLLAHAHRRRLAAEPLRDAILFVSGQLQLDPPRGPTYSAGLNADFGFLSEDTHRSVYLPVFRNALPQLFEAFDFPPSSMVTGRREVSTVPTQALFLLNHPWMQAQSRAAALRALDRASGRGQFTVRLTMAYRRTLGRAPTRAEQKLALQHLVSGVAPSDREEAWASFFHALFASGDFRYLE